MYVMCLPCFMLIDTSICIGVKTMDAFSGVLMLHFLGMELSIRDFFSLAFIEKLH
jgi:hypothetical protein